MTIITGIIGFFLSALALKLALGAFGQPARENSYSTAVTVAGLLSVLSLALSFIPFVGWVIYPLAWIILVKAVYRLRLGRSIAVGAMQVLIRAGLWWLLSLVF